MPLLQPVAAAATAAFLIVVTVLTLRPAAANLLPTLHRQALSHHAFHADAVKVALARLAAPANADADADAGHAHVAVVGVEWGRDVEALLTAGFRVTAVEGDADHAASLRRRAQAEGWGAHLAVIEAYAGDGTDGAVMIDAMLGNTGVLAVLSVDVQGAEHKVLQGARKALADRRIRTLWVESIACRADALHALHLLHNLGYILYDFAPWGQPRAEERRHVPNSRASFVYHPQRPNAIDEYWQWLCDVQQERYLWLQTDIIAVLPEANTVAFTDGLKNLSHLCDVEPDVTCTLRLLVDNELSSDVLDDARESLDDDVLHPKDEL